MMSLGSHNGGGRPSSSSSNLSPLAPPFTLDKPYHKEHNSNPPANFTEQPYGPRLDRPRTIWTAFSINSSFGPNFPENSSKDGNFSPSDVHGFQGSQSNNSSPNAHLVSPNSAASNGYDGFPYGQYSNSTPTSLVDAKPYYPPYVLANDRNVVAHNKPSYDLLSNFGSGQLGGSSQVDGTRTVSGVEYTPQWGGLWNGLNDVEQVNWLDLGGSFGSKDCKPDSSTGQKCMKKGSDAGGDHYDFHTAPLVGSLETYVGACIKSSRFDTFGDANNFAAPSIEDHRSLKESNPGATTISSARASALRSTSACNENLHLQDPFLQASRPKCFGTYECPVDSRDSQADYTDSYVFDSTSTMIASPASMTKMTFGGFPSPHDAFLSTTVNAMKNEAIDKIEKSPDFLPYHPFGLNVQANNYTGKGDSLFTRSSSIKMEDNLNKKLGNDDCINQLLKTKSVSPIPHLTVTECLKIKSDAAETFYSMEKPSDGPDIHNPAEDSPCWKGAPAARFSPFEDSKMVTPDVVLENSESCFNSKGEEHKDSPIGLVTTDTIHVSEEVNDHTSKRSSDANFVSREYDASCSMKQGELKVKLYGGDGFQSLDKMHGLDFGMGNEFPFLKYSEIASSSKSSSVQTDSEGHEEKLASTAAATAAELKDKCPNATSSAVLSWAETNAGDHQLQSPSGDVIASKVGQLLGKDSNSRVDVSTLVNAVKNLSEVLVYHCSNSDETPTGLDRAALKYIINNLNFCLVKEVDQVTEKKKPQDFSQQGTSSLEGALQDQMVRKVRAVHTDQHDLDSTERWKHEKLSSRNEGLLDSSLKDNAETARDTETIQAIKKVLAVNFPGDEMQPETLYKNLWLEAEAALCAITVRSRFNRMKTEMEKREYHEKNDEENVPMSKASDINKVAEAPHEADDSLDSSKHSSQTDMESSVIARFRNLRSIVEDLKSTKPVGQQELKKESQGPSLESVAYHMPLFFPNASPESHANDSEASIMARFQTLKSRADNSDPISTEDGQTPIKDSFGSPSPDHSIQDSYFSSISNHKDGPEASVMSRFNILKRRIEQSETADMDTQQLPGQLDGPTLTSFFSTEKRSCVQPKGENLNDSLGASMSLNPGNNPCKVSGLGDELLEGWYDCSESGWEHVKKESSPNQN